MGENVTESIDSSISFQTINVDLFCFRFRRQPTSSLTRTTKALPLCITLLGKGNPR